MPDTIETFDLTRRFGRTEAVKGLNLQVPTGSICLAAGAPVHYDDHVPIDCSSSVVVLSSQPRYGRSRRRIAHRGVRSVRGMALATIFGSVSHSAEPNGFDLTSDVIRFPELHGADVHAIDVSAGWLAKAELVIVQTTGAGTIARAVEIPSFEIVAASPTVAR